MPREEWTIIEKETLILGPDMIHCFISVIPSAVVEEGGKICILSLRIPGKKQCLEILIG